MQKLIFLLELQDLPSFLKMVLSVHVHIPAALVAISYNCQMYFQLIELPLKCRIVKLMVLNVHV